MTRIADKRRKNLRDVARAANVSVATVSRVLNTPAIVSTDTRTRVLDAMKSLHFVPSAAARAINSGRTRMVAALLPTLDNSIYARLVDGLEHRLSAHGLTLVVAQTRDDQALKLERAKQLIDVGAEGFVVAGITQSEAFNALIEHTRIPVVSVSYYAPDHHTPTVGYDNWEAARIAVDHLQGLGHRNIAVVHGPRHNNDRTDRRCEAIEAIQVGGTFSLFEVDISFEGAAQATDRILREAPQATGILCFSDILAMGVLNALHRHGRRVPKDLSVMGIENLPNAAFTHPPLTSVRLQVQSMGERAADAIAIWLDSGERPDHARMPVEVIQRASTAPRS